MKGLVFRVFLTMTLAAAAAPASASSADMRVRSSESLPPAGEIRYGAANLTDRNIRTAWCVKGDSGSTAWFSLHFRQPTPLSVLGWFGGYQKNKRVFQANARARTVAVYADGRLLGRFGLDDRMGLQRLDLPGEQASAYEFVIEAVYPGTKYDDLCVTEVLLGRRTVDGFRLAESLARDAGNRALSEVEIKVKYREIFSFWRTFFDDSGVPVGPEYDRPFWNAVALRTSARDEGSLRFILNLHHYAADGPVIPVELLEGLRDLVIPYFEANASVVADLWEDRNQAGRYVIESAFFMYIDPWSSRVAAERRKNDPGFARFADLICRKIAAEGAAPKFCPD